MNTVTEEELWEVQLRHWPESRRLTEQEVVDWVFAPGLTGQTQGRRAMMVVIALQNPVRVWYRTHAANTPAGAMRPEGGWMGCRYGKHDGDYISGFDNVNG